MFSYFGSKSKLLKLYPKPLYPRIIEPFAGSARYACRYHRGRKVWLNDVYPVVYDIWRWIVSATPEMVRALPELNEPSLDINDMGLEPTVRNLMGFAVNMGQTRPANKVSGFSVGYTKSSCRDRIGRNTTESRKLKGRLLELVEHGIGHWKVTNLSYEQMPDVEATWYIDPPYQRLGDVYVHGAKTIDYGHLGDWCRSRRGQVIVCEGGGADWLPFTDLRQRPIRRLSRGDAYYEQIWYRSDRKDDDTLGLE